MNLNYEFPYTSARMPLMASNVVATSQPLAAQAGLQMFFKGGNAVDAALAAAIALTVVEPTGNGIGSDAFAIVWDGQCTHGLNASGKSPEGLDPARFRGLSSMPSRGWDTVTIPGAVSAWAELSDRFGNLEFRSLFEPAIRYAEAGFLVSPVIAAAWRQSESLLAGFSDFEAAFLPRGRAPRAGEIFIHPEQGRTLREIADTHGESFYRGHLASRMAEHARMTGGILTEEDLRSHTPVWCTTTYRPYHGAEVHVLPPNGQGLAVLLMLGVLECHPLYQGEMDTANGLHLQIEAMKLALADVSRYVADPSSIDLDPEELLNDAYLRERSQQIDMVRAGDPGHGRPKHGGTVYVTAADESGMMVSYIQSNYQGFGSGIVIPGTGISLQNRGSCFSVQPGHPNEVAGGKRPFHTIVPGFLSGPSGPLASFGVMGGLMQAQGQAQVVQRLLHHKQNPQTASDAPRWRVLGGKEVAVEAGFSSEVIAELRRRGHVVSERPRNLVNDFGGAQIICRVDGGYVAGSDHRKDGQAAGF